MEYFRKTKERLMETVGLTQKIPDDPELVQSQQRLKLLYTTIHSMKTSMTQYANSMCGVGDAARKLSDDISKFYVKSPPHQDSIHAFVDASLDQESNTLLLFKEQFHQDITAHFDQWLYDLKRENDILKALVDQHQYIYTLKQRIQDVQGNQTLVDGYQSELNGSYGVNAVKYDMQEIQKLEKSFVQKKRELISTINTMLQQRYERFDVVFMRLMEFQKEFFCDGLDVTEKYTPILQQYRSKNKIAAANTNNIPKQQQQAAAAPKPQQQQQQATAAPKPQQPKPEPQVDAKPQPETPKPQQPQAAVPAQQQQQPKEVNLFDLDFSASPSTASKPSQKQNTSANDNIFDIFNTPSTTTSNAKPSPTPQQNNTSNNASDDLFGMFSSPSSNAQPQAQQQQSGSLEDFFAGPSTGAKAKPATTSATGGLDGFDSFLTGSSSRSPAASGLDDIDDAVTTQAKPKTTSSTNLNDDLLSGFSSTNNTNAPKSYGFASASTGFDDFDPLSGGSSSAQPAKSTYSSYQPAANPDEIDDGPQLTATEEEAAIHAHKRDLEIKVQAWRYKHGQERDIQGLLSTLHNVLWTGHTWKKVDSTSLLDYNSTKKVFRRALLTVHPDKVSTGNPEMKATADIVFEILNNAFKRYEVSQGLRSA